MHTDILKLHHVYHLFLHYLVHALIFTWSTCNSYAVKHNWSVREYSWNGLFSLLSTSIPMEVTASMTESLSNGNKKWIKCSHQWKLSVSIQFYFSQPSNIQFQYHILLLQTLLLLRKLFWLLVPTAPSYH